VFAVGVDGQGFETQGLPVKSDRPIEVGDVEADVSGITDKLINKG
jgi:hypothetical protein